MTSNIRRKLSVVILGAALLLGVMLGAPTLAQSAGNQAVENEMRIRVIIDGQILTATLEDNATTRDFVSLLPLDLTLTDFNSTEKISDLPRRLTTEGAPRSTTPSAGDVSYYAPWGNLALFYRDFRDSPNLVRLGVFDGNIEALHRDEPFEARFELAE